MARTYQVAALPWRKSNSEIEILMITTRTTRRWVIPKGWPMPGKTDHAAAAIEAYEEAGVRGVVLHAPCSQYGYVKLSDNGKERVLSVTVYPLRVETELADWPERNARERRWMSIAEAAAIAGEPELVRVLSGFVEPVIQLGLWQRLRGWLGR